ncbi:MAG: hypothetical protein ACFFB5_06955 [Promethearchaeota archaeon]
MMIKRVAITGHAGIGHVHGYGGLIQDDSAGFVTVASMIKEILHVNTFIEDVDIDLRSNTIKITTLDGGSSTSIPRRGITPGEATLMRNLVGQDALFCQSLTLNTLGRMYGQGVLETPVCLQGALANSVVSTFKKKGQNNFKTTVENVDANCGLIGGMRANINGVDTSLLVTVNQTINGLGPVEDLEGNIALGSKYELMKELDMLRCPTIVVESKAYSPLLSDHLKENTFLIRAQKGIDNPVVANALVDSVEELGFPVIFRDDLLPQKIGFMKQNTKKIADKIINYANDLKNTSLASEKVMLVAKMAKLISQDAGSITCISEELYDVVRGAGMIPGMAAVISILVTKEYYKHWKIPVFEEKDVEISKSILNHAVKKISSKINEAYDYIEQHYTDICSLEQIIIPK